MGAISYEEFREVRSNLTNPIKELCSVDKEITGFKLKDYLLKELTIVLDGYNDQSSFFEIVSIGTGAVKQHRRTVPLCLPTVPLCLQKGAKL